MGSHERLPPRMTPLWAYGRRTGPPAAATSSTNGSLSSRFIASNSSQNTCKVRATCFALRLPGGLPEHGAFNKAPFGR